MALSRIWSAFIIVSVFVACFKWLAWKDNEVFNRIVVGKADDTYGYVLTGQVNARNMAQDSFVRSMSLVGLSLKDKAPGSKYVFTDDPLSDSVKILKAQNPSLLVMTYSQALKRIQKPVDGIIETCWTAVNIALKLIGIMALFMGFMSIAERAGGISLLSRIIGPFFTKLFPEIPKGHPAMGHMMMNFSANLLGLDNAATPFGLKTMESLQELNPNKAVASNAQIMFLCLHACGPTLIPVSIIASPPPIMIGPVRSGKITAKTRVATKIMIAAKPLFGTVIAVSPFETSKIRSGSSARTASLSRVP